MNQQTTFRPLLPTEQRMLRSNTPHVQRYVEDAGRGLPTSRQVYRRKPARRHRLLSKNARFLLGNIATVAFAFTVCYIMVAV